MTVVAQPVQTDSEEPPVAPWPSDLFKLGAAERTGGCGQSSVGALLDFGHTGPEPSPECFGRRGRNLQTGQLRS